MNIEIRPIIILQVKKKNKQKTKKSCITIILDLWLDGWEIWSPTLWPHCCRRCVCVWEHLHWYYCPLLTRGGGRSHPPFWCFELSFDFFLRLLLDKGIGEPLLYLHLQFNISLEMLFMWKTIDYHSNNKQDIFFFTFQVQEL